MKIGVIVDGRAEFHSLGLVLPIVLKTTTFENWLIADTNAIDSLQALFPNPERITRRAAKDRADNLNALQLLEDNISEKIRQDSACASNLHASESRYGSPKLPFVSKISPVTRPS